MKRNRRLFVYGTLAPDAGTPMGDWIAARLVGAEPATAPGRLFAVRGGNGWYPALLPARASARVALPTGALPIHAGDFARWLRLTRRKPFTTPCNAAMSRPCPGQPALAIAGPAH